jgi:hypothetical protein
MINVTPVLGCDYNRSTGHIDENAGSFAPLTEGFRRVKTGNIVPAINNTRCACRGSKHCSVNCPSAVSGYSCGGRISFHNVGKRM